MRPAAAAAVAVRAVEVVIASADGGDARLLVVERRLDLALELCLGDQHVQVSPPPEPHVHGTRAFAFALALACVPVLALSGVAAERRAHQ